MSYPVCYHTSNMKFLIIETSTKKSFIALAMNGSIQEVIFLEGGKALSKTIDSALQRLLSQTKIENISAVSCGIGPGSYTGVRTGVMIAKIFSYAKRIPIISFTSLQAFLGEAKSAALLDARSAGIYLLEENRSPMLYDCEKAARTLPTYSSLFSPDPAPLKARFPNLSIREKKPDLSRIAAISAQKYQKKEMGDHASISPLYLK